MVLSGIRQEKAEMTDAIHGKFGPLISFCDCNKTIV